MKKRLFLSSAVMTGVLAVALSTGTYAWYTINGVGEVKTVNASSYLVTSKDTYGGLGGQLEIEASFLSVEQHTGKRTALGNLPEGKTAEVYNGTDGDEGNVVRDGQIMSAEDFTCPTYSSETGLADVDLTNKAGHSYANAKTGLTDVTDQAKKPYGVFTIKAEDKSQTALLIKNLQASVAETEFDGVAVGTNSIKLTLTVHAVGHVRISNKEDITMFTNTAGNNLTYEITLSGKDGSITASEGVTVKQFDDDKEQTISWTFENIFYTVEPAVKENSVADDADTKETEGHETGKNVDGIELIWTSEMITA
jgi:hypothetical protein